MDGSKNGFNCKPTSGVTKDGDNKVPSPTHATLDLNTPLSNPFDVLNTVTEDVGPSVQIPKVSEPVGGRSASKGGNEEAQSNDHDSLWEKFKASKEASSSKSKSTSRDPILFNADYDFGMRSLIQMILVICPLLVEITSLKMISQTDMRLRFMIYLGNWMLFVISLTSVLKVMVESR
ncbi:hypothetical protein Tco_0743028 [Tanacetum coccineum]